MPWYRNASGRVYHKAANDWVRTGRAVCGANIARASYVANAREAWVTPGGALRPWCKLCARKLKPLGT